MTPFALFAEVDTTGLGTFFQANGLLLLPIVVFFVGLYLLLPRVRGGLLLLGGVLAAVGLAFGAALLIRTETVLPETILFCAFSGGAIVFGVLMIVQKNPVHSALSFAMVVLSTCGLFLLQAAPFLMAATIIIYAGAIVVTFLFVIMLAQQEGVSNADQRSREPFLACLAGGVFLASLICVLHRNYDTGEIDRLLPQVRTLADAKSADDVKRVLGEPSPSKLVPDLVKELKDQFGEGAISIEADNVKQQWIRKDTKATIESAGRLRVALELSRQQHGSLALFNVPGKDKTPGHSRDPGKLPAQNVAAIGRTLFTDYLVPVELAAVLLLVATIGAIVIAHRKSEELR